MSEAVSCVYIRVDGISCRLLPTEGALEQLIHEHLQIADVQAEQHDQSPPQLQRALQLHREKEGLNVDCIYIRLPEQPAQLPPLQHGSQADRVLNVIDSDKQAPGCIVEHVLASQQLPVK